MDQWCVTLNPAQMQVVRQLAERRQRSAWSRGAHGRNNAPNDYASALALHVKGTPGEYAYWAWVFYHRCGLLIPNCVIPRRVEPPRWASRFRRDFDFFPDTDIKTADHPRKNMLVQQDAPDDWRYLLVDTSAAPLYRMVGWMWGSDCKQQMWWTYMEREDGTDGSCYKVPRLALRSMNEWRYQHPWEEFHAAWSDSHPRPRANI